MRCPICKTNLIVRQYATYSNAHEKRIGATNNELKPVYTCPEEHCIIHHLGSFDDVGGFMANSQFIYGDIRSLCPHSILSAYDTPERVHEIERKVDVKVLCVIGNIRIQRMTSFYANGNEPCVLKRVIEFYTIHGHRCNGILDALLHFLHIRK